MKMKMCRSVYFLGVYWAVLATLMMVDVLFGPGFGMDAWIFMDVVVGVGAVLVINCLAKTALCSLAMRRQNDIYESIYSGDTTTVLRRLHKNAVLDLLTAMICVAMMVYLLATHASWVLILAYAAVGAFGIVGMVRYSKLSLKLRKWSDGVIDGSREADEGYRTYAEMRETLTAGQMQPLVTSGYKAFVVLNATCVLITLVFGVLFICQSMPWAMAEKDLIASPETFFAIGFLAVIVSARDIAGWEGWRWRRSYFASSTS